MRLRKPLPCSKDAPYGYIFLVYQTLHENDRISCFSNDNNRYFKKLPFFNGRYAIGVPWGESCPYKTSYTCLPPPPPPAGGTNKESVHLLECWQHSVIVLLCSGGSSESHPLIFRPNWGPKGRNKIFFWFRAPSLSQGLGDRAPPPPALIWRSGCYVM